MGLKDLMGMASQAKALMDGDGAGGLDIGNALVTLQTLSDPARQQSLLVSVFSGLLATLIVAELEKRPVPQSFIDTMATSGYPAEEAEQLYRFVCKSIMEASN